MSCYWNVKSREVINAVVAEVGVDDEASRISPRIQSLPAQERLL